MSEAVPHLVQYQGSKRLLAPQILSFVNKPYSRLIEPFAGTAAVSIAAAAYKKADQFLINDLNEPLINMLEAVTNRPSELSTNYQRLWSEQYNMPETQTHIDHFYKVRAQFNAGDRSPENMLYLLARVVKGAVRYDSKGNLNQSPDKRRHGTKPETIRKNALAISYLLKDRAEFTALDFSEVLERATSNDLVYLDPPYQGVSFTKDHRYYSGVSIDSLEESLANLNNRNVDFILSYDGISGNTQYGRDLLDTLGCKKILLAAGRSSQATILGRNDITYEGLYLSRNLAQDLSTAHFEQIPAGMVYTYE